MRYGKHVCVAVLAMAMAAPMEEAHSEDAQSIEGVEEMVASYTRCAGFWTWLADSSRRAGKSAAADYINTYANGAYTTALWLLGSQYVLQNPEGPPRSYGSFGPQIDGLKETERLRMAALEEAGDSESLEAKYTLCEGLTEGSEIALDLMRKEIYGHPQPQP